MPAAATARTASSASAECSPAFGKIQRKQVGSPYKPSGTHLIQATLTLADTDVDHVGDVCDILKFPPNCRLLALKATATDLDTHATPTLTFNIAYSATAATAGGTALISATDVGKAGGTAYLGTTYQGGIVDVSDKYLSFDVEVVSATPAAGTLVVEALVYLGDPATITGS